MTDFDPDAYLTQTNDTSAESPHQPAAFDPDAYLKEPESASTPDSTVYDAAEFKRRVGREPEGNELANFKQFKGEGFANNGTGGGSFAGMGEAALALGSGTLKAITHAANDIIPDSDGSRAAVEKEIQQDPILNYHGGPEAQQYLQGVATLATPVTWAADKAHQAISAVASPRAADVAGDIATLLPGARGTVDLKNIGSRIINSMNDPEAGAVDNSGSLSNSQQSMGAAKTAPMTGAGPEFQEGIRKAAQQTGGAVNETAVERIRDAESLPVKAQLSPGQSSGDPSLFSEEKNLRGTDEKRANFYTDQNKNLIANFDALRDRVGPDVFSSEPVGHADVLIDKYEGKDKVARAAIDNAYETARKSIPSTTPVLDAKNLLDNVNAQLEDKWATESAPADVMRRLQAMADKGKQITAGQFEGLRTRLAELARSGDGSTRFAANQIRGIVEGSEFLPGTEAFKAPFDQARALARSHFQELEADPAYNDAVNDITPPDRFIQKHITGQTATRDGVSAMRTSFADDPVATQTMDVAALDHLRRSALGTSGNVSQSAFNKQWTAMSPKKALFDPATREDLDTIGRVSGYQQVQPPGSFVNNSNTTVSALSTATKMGTEAAKAAAETGLNIAGAKTIGIPIVGTVVRNFAEKRAAEKAAAAAKQASDKATQEFLDPYGGLKILKPSQTAPTNIPAGQSPLSSVVKTTP